MSKPLKYEHLSDQAKQYLDKTSKERIHYILSSRWIGYPKAKEIIAKMEDLLAYPTKQRMPCMLIVGDSNAGKTMIADRFVALNPAYEREDGQGIVIPVLSIQSPPIPSESRLYSNILEKMFAPYRPSDSIEKKHYQVITLMRACNVKLLMIDEIHSLLAGNSEKQRTFLSVIRNLSNELKIPLIGLGTKDALRAIKTDPQLDNRFKPFTLPNWSYNNDYRRLLASFEKMLPLKYSSDLHKQQLATKLLYLSDGLLGELSEILSDAAVLAIQTRKEKIDLELLKKLNAISPKERQAINA